MKLDIVYAAESLDGVAAVNLDEPSPGDLERVYQEYLKTLRENRELKSLVSEALKFIKNCAEEDFLRFTGDIEEACRLRDKIIASSEGVAENSTKYVLIQDDDSHWYLIKQSHRGLFLSLLSEAVETGDHDRFCEAFDSCRLGTAPSFISFENPIDIQEGKPLERR